MLKREFKEVIKQTIYLLLFMGFMLLVFKIRSVLGNLEYNFSEYASIFYQLFIFFFSFFLGISMFSREIRNNGFEYLLTLPYSRSKLLWMKIIPRFSMLVFLYLVYLLLLLISKTDPFLIAPVSFHAIYFSLFFISTSLSVLRGNFVANSIFTGMMFILSLAAANLPPWLVIRKYFSIGENFKLRIFTVGDTFPFSPFSIVLLGLLVSVPFIISLFYGFKKFDVRSSGKYLKRFFTILIPLVLAGMIFSYFILKVSAGEPRGHYYITKKGIILKYDYSGTYVVSKEGNRKLPDFYPYRRNFYETDKAVYSSVWHWEDNPNGNIIRFNDQFKKSKSIYAPADRKFLSRKLFGYGNTIAFLESSGKKYSWNRSAGNHVVFLNTDTKGVEKFEFPFDNLNLIGVSNEAGGRIWIGYFIENQGVTVYTMNSQGKIDRILRSNKDPKFISGQLITFEKREMVFGRFGDTGYEETGRIQIKENIIYPYYQYSSELNVWNMTYLYGKILKNKSVAPDQKQSPLEFVRINLESHSVERFHCEGVVRGILYPVFSGDTFLISLKRKKDIQFDGIYQMRGLELKPVEDFKSVDVVVRENWGLAGSGFVIGNGDAVKFYLFPDLKELK